MWAGRFALISLLPAAEALGAGARPTSRQQVRGVGDIRRGAAYRDRDALSYQTAELATTTAIANAPRSVALPPVGATFTDTMLLPVIGLQTVKLSIISRSRARLRLSGALLHDDTIEYGLDSAGDLEFLLSDHTLRLVHALGVSIARAEYCPKNDRARITLKIPAFPALLVELRRLHGPRRWRTAGSARLGAQPLPPRAPARATARQGVLPLAGSLVMRTLWLPARGLSTMRGVLRAARAPATASAQPQPQPASQPPAAAPAATPSTTACDSALPPLGSTYAHTLKLPVLGVQSFRLTIETGSAAHIAMDGAIRLAEPIEYGVGARGELDFKLSEGTQRMLRGFGVSLTAAEYCAQMDRAFVTVKPPAVPALKIQLNRVRDGN
ncbi:hypothetical protein KFE25_011879 [Diacronema lutheri]|uniref:Lipid-binding serum glycoprotein C-terminal domain-containing protein n=1 Tax=Diacronema lutheri TaxID=2081491 RepID=A0A8J6CAE2_DIALT|nr:hypothetical protein KFE25_011879 [Diacronema lutheri]